MRRSMKAIALVVTAGTVLSKAGGLLRQLVLAAAFGVGVAYDAYNYAYVLPGFLLILLGGINGPLYSSILSVLTRRPREEASYILSALTSGVSVLLLITTIVLVLAANPLITMVGPGLSAESHRIAVIQLQIMSPMALLAGLIGLGFGALNAVDEFWIPAVSPLMSSGTLIIGVGFLWWRLGEEIAEPQQALIGGILLGAATLIGAFLQWLIQLPSLISKGLSRFQFVWDWNHPGVREVLRILGPATLSSGMLHINVYIDLFFASGIAGAAAGLGYANLLVQTPLGLLSNALLVPLLPIFSQLTAKKDRFELISRIRQGLMISTAAMLPMGAFFIVLGAPIVELVYERGAFDESAAQMVTGLLMAYGVGMPAYLCRDVLVRVFYAIGDATTPFRLSLAGIFLNILFDWLLLGGSTPWGYKSPVNFGASGLILATAMINIFTCIFLLLALQRRLGKLPLFSWTLDSVRLILAVVAAAFLSWFLSNNVEWPGGKIGLVMQVFFSGILGIGLYGLVASAFNVPEVIEMSHRLNKRIGIVLRRR